MRAVSNEFAAGSRGVAELHGNKHVTMETSAVVGTKCLPRASQILSQKELTLDTTSASLLHSPRSQQVQCMPRSRENTIRHVKHFVQLQLFISVVFNFFSRVIG